MPAGIKPAPYGQAPLAVFPDKQASLSPNAAMMSNGNGSISPTMLAEANAGLVGAAAALVATSSCCSGVSAGARAAFGAEEGEEDEEDKTEGNALNKDEKRRIRAAVREFL